MSAPAPGGRTRDVREEIARALTAEDGERSGPGVDWPAYADAVLACPAVADALAAVERVRALAEELIAESQWNPHAARGSYDNGVQLAKDDVAHRLRRALDGPT